MPEVMPAKRCESRPSLSAEDWPALLEEGLDALLEVVADGGVDSSGLNPFEVVGGEISLRLSGFTGGLLMVATPIVSSTIWIRSEERTEPATLTRIAGCIFRTSGRLRFVWHARCTPLRMNFGDRFRVAPGSKVRLGDIDAGFHGKHGDKTAAAAELQKCEERLRQLQHLLYADCRRSLLVVLQGLDASGKDGTISHVFSTMNPEGVRVASFKKPTEEELAHDFLWRVHAKTPKAGELVLFNRSHYEDVLVVRVHDLVPKKVWSTRYERINEFEENLVERGTAIIKFYLHISPDEQLARFEQRLDDPERRWKISEADYEERKLWPAYVDAFEDTFHETSTSHAPWYLIPANHKWFRNLAISSIVADALESMGLELPKSAVDVEEIRKKYHSAAKGERALERSVSAR